MADYGPEVTYIVLMGALALASFSLSIASCVRIHKRKDAARKGFLWLKLAFPSFTLGTLLLSAKTILVFFPLDYDNWSGIEAEFRLLDFGDFFSTVASLLILLATIEVGLGILQCWDIAHKGRRFLQWSTYGLVFVEIVLAIAVLARYEVIWTRYFAYLRGVGLSGDDDLYNSPQIRDVLLALNVLLWLATLALVVLTITIGIWARKRSDHRRATTFLIVASLLCFISQTWSLAILASYTTGTLISGAWSFIASPILGFYPLFIAMVLLFVIGNQRLGGLWSIPQDFGPGNQHAAYGQPPGQPQPYYPAQYGTAIYAQPQVYPQQPYGQPGQYPAGQTGWVQSSNQYELENQRDPYSPTSGHQSELRGSEAATEMQTSEGLNSSHEPQRYEMK